MDGLLIAIFTPIMTVFVAWILIKVLMFIIFKK